MMSSNPSIGILITKERQLFSFYFIAASRADVEKLLNRGWVFEIFRIWHNTPKIQLVDGGFSIEKFIKNANNFVNF